MKLLARFKRWCHLMQQFITLSIFRGKAPCCAVDVPRVEHIRTTGEDWVDVKTRHWTEIRCTCGREWK